MFYLVYMVYLYLSELLCLELLCFDWEVKKKICLITQA